MTPRIISMGTIIPLGDGLVGKTVLLKLLLKDEYLEDEVSKILNETPKSKNIEMEFGSDTVELDGKQIKTSLQYYNFPGQIQKDSSRTVTFDEILKIFEFLPALKSVSVLLLIYDVSRIYTLKSLENWLKVALGQNWITENTLIILISNKIDLQEPNLKFVTDILRGIRQYLEQEGHPKVKVKSIYTSCKNLVGVDEVRKNIVEWIAKNGKKGSL